jgi:hypothetical protein
MTQEDIQIGDVSHLVVDVNDTRRIPFFVKNGPLKAVTMLTHQYDFLKSQSFSMEVLKAVLKNGTTINRPTSVFESDPVPEHIANIIAPVIPEAAAPEAPAPAAPQESVAELIEDVKTPEQAAPEGTEGAGESKSEESTEDSTQGTGTGEKINLLTTIGEENGEVTFSPLTEEQYSTYSKAELTEFLQKMAPHLSEEAQATIAGFKKNTTVAQMVEVIKANLLG